MGKHIARLATICVVGAVAIAPVAGAYSTPKPTSSGGSKAGQKSSGGAAKGAGKKIQGKTGGQLANGFTITVHFPKAGKVSCTVKHNSEKLGGGSTSSSKKGSKKLKITFTNAGKAFLTGPNAGQPVTISCTFKPKSGKSSTSKTTVKLG